MKANDKKPKLIFYCHNFAESKPMKASDKTQVIHVQNFISMNTLRNKVSLIGRLGAQPEVVKFDSGRTLARFSIATNERYKSKDGEWQEVTQWHNCTAWGKTADLIAKLLNKGQEVIVEGKLVNNSYETKEGEKRYGTTVELSEFLILAPKNESK